MVARALFRDDEEDGKIFTTGMQCLFVKHGLIWDQFVGVDIRMEW